MLLHQLTDALQITGPGDALERHQGAGSNSEGIADREADTAIAQIERQDSAGDLGGSSGARALPPHGL
jgi:hypothetical protein